MGHIVGAKIKILMDNNHSIGLIDRKNNQATFGAPNCHKATRRGSGPFDTNHNLIEPRIGKQITN